MEQQQKDENEILLGLLECPIRQGFIEFEYQSGDLVSELKSRIMEVWGEPISHTGRRGRYGLFDSGQWAILCQDESGAYMPLKDTDEIPAMPPKASDIIHESQLHHLMIRRRDYDLSGVIHDIDLENAEYRHGHIQADLNRQYSIPNTKTYSVKLVALVMVSGG